MYLSSTSMETLAGQVLTQEQLARPTMDWYADCERQSGDSTDEEPQANARRPQQRQERGSLHEPPQRRSQTRSRTPSPDTSMQAGPGPRVRSAITRPPPAENASHVSTPALALGVRPMCLFCDGDHALCKCHVFVYELRGGERRDFIYNYVVTKGGCVNCFRTSHTAWQCTVAGCNLCDGAPHNSLLCERRHGVDAVVNMPPAIRAAPQMVGRLYLRELNLWMQRRSEYRAARGSQRSHNQRR